MNSRTRAVLLGAAAGIGYTAVRVFFPRSGGVVVGGPDLERLVFETLLQAVVMLAVVPGFVLFAARGMDWRPDADWTRLSALVGVGALLGVAAGTPVLTAVEEGVGVGRLLEPRYVAAWTVNGVGPGVHAAVGALAGFLLGEHKT